ncbi:hypothetical protein CBS101457_002507 [Exobasidium rhododendri]|nr:hypothetical protein CBS101457_002507 [Exobasidium rhododendri]
MTTGSISPASEWAKPTTRPAHIEQLISGVDRYNPQNLATLSDYLSHQLESGEYDCLANLAILKLFQFNPQEFDYNVVVSVLFKALTGAPHPDFNLCLSLLGEAPVSVLSTAAPVISEDTTEEQKLALQKEATEAASAPSAGSLTDPMFVKLAALSSLLLSARFREFWKVWQSSEYSDARSFAKSVHGFEDSVRWVALDTVKGAFRTIGKARLAEYLNMPASEVASYVEEQAGWTVEGDKVLIPANADNDVKATVIREDLQLDQLTKFLSQAQTPILRA